jgi:hypothetical protein
MFTTPEVVEPKNFWYMEVKAKFQCAFSFPINNGLTNIARGLNPGLCLLCSPVIFLCPQPQSGALVGGLPSVIQNVLRRVYKQNSPGSLQSAVILIAGLPSVI